MLLPGESQLQLHIYGITYADKKTEYIPYHNQPMAVPHRFEWNAILDIIDNHIGHIADDDLLGILSHKFPQKTGLSKVDVYKLMNQHLVISPTGIFSLECTPPAPAELYNLSPQFSYPIAGKYESFFDWCEAGHPGISGLMQACCNASGIFYAEPVYHPKYGSRKVIYAGQFITTKKIYTHFVNTCIRPSIALMEGPVFWDIVNQPAGYTAGLQLSELKRLTGLDFYNYVPFVLERMMMHYSAHYNLKTIDLK